MPSVDKETLKMIDVTTDRQSVAGRDINISGFLRLLLRLS